MCWCLGVGVKRIQEVGLKSFRGSDVSADIWDTQGDVLYKFNSVFASVIGTGLIFSIISGTRWTGKIDKL